MRGPSKRRRPIAPILILVALCAGCPPTGEPPPFEPQGPDADVEAIDGATPLPDAEPEPDAEADAEVDAAPDMAPDTGPPPGCVDRDDDGYVEREGCELPPGDCAPDDGDRRPLAAERCDGLDDDCDGEVDEGAPAGLPCETDQPGRCAPGSTACREGAEVCVADARPAAGETCDGVDEDCDGQTDEEPTDIGDDCDIDGAEGACADGIETCEGGRRVCEARAEPALEACNGVDDDCDGAVDEGDPEGGGDCRGELPGICNIGTAVCVGGRLQCRSRREPMPEACNALDDDCDGEVDEPFVDRLGAPCTVGAGRCAGDGVWVCDRAGDRVVCDASPEDAEPELCNGVDDDCDGQLDERFDLGAPCAVGVGACAAEGALICVADAAACSAAPGEPDTERCNAVDDDCDGAVDEGFPVGLACVDDGGLCPAPGTLACDDEGGVRCDAPPVMPRDEVCNRADDDCDGRTDEGFAGLGDRCAVGVGLCRREGVQVCVDEAVGCSVQAGAPVAELCNGLDDDCEGRIDNRAPCLGPPTAVATLRIAPADDPACLDLDGDGAADPDADGNAFAALADAFGEALAADFDSGRRVLLVRVPDADDPDARRVQVELVEGHPDGPSPLLRGLTPEGRGRHAVRDVARDGEQLAGGAPGTLRLPSPLFYDRDPAFEAESGLTLYRPRVVGSAAADGARLTLDGLRLVGRIDRFEAQRAYDTAAARCVALGAEAPAGCAIVRGVTPVQLDALMVADIDRDPTPGPDALSACFILDGPPLDPAVGVPYGGEPCAADSDCYANLSCRPMPTGGPPGGAALAERCGVPGPGGGRLGDPCAGDDDCEDALCVAATAAGGACTGLCEADAQCPVGLVCRGIARDVAGATTPGGASAAVCVPVDGSGLACGADADCPGDELCGVWLDGAGVAGGPVRAAGRCQTLDPAGAPLGARCERPEDCAHGNGCVPDLDGALRCLPPCDGAGQCADGTICVERTVLGAIRQFAAVEHGFCLPVPPALGSGGRCDADADCPTGETCTPRVLATTGAVERYCAAGAGFATVGQRCQAHGDCASNRCDGGRCSGLCATDEDCAPFMGCAPDALRDDDDRVLGGLCRPATFGCGSDLDCAADPVCDGDRCVCLDDRCRIGCRPPDGVCPDPGHRCQPDGGCAPYCRDDVDEPDDSPATAVALPVDPRRPTAELRRSLCAGSPVDHLRIAPAGQPVQVRLDSPPRPDLIFALDLFDADGAVIAEGQPLDPLDVIVASVDDPQGPVTIRIRAAGLLDRVDYRLRVELRGDACVDPTEPAPADDPLGGVELLAESGAVAVDAAEGVVCPADVDYAPLWLDARDRITLDLEEIDRVGDGVQLRLWGPDAPGLPGSAVRATLLDGAGGRAEYEAQPMSCPVGGGVCRHQGVATAIPCASGADCRGAPYYVELRGATDRDGGGWRLTASVDRLVPRACTPDRLEPDDRHTAAERLAARRPTAFVEGALDSDRDLALPPLRLCPQAPDGASIDADRYPVEARAGDRLVADLTPQPGATLELRFLRPDGDGFALIGAVEVDRETRAGQDVAADGTYAVEIGRAAGIEPLDYTLILRRETAASDDTGCPEAEPVALDGDPRIIDTDTAGRADSVAPLDCPGGGGPDRIYAVTVPPGATTLTAVAEALAEGVDPALSVRTECAVRISERACNEDDPDADEPRARSALTVPVVGGSTVYVALDSFDSAGAGPTRLTLTAE